MSIEQEFTELTCAIHVIENRDKWDDQTIIDARKRISDCCVSDHPGLRKMADDAAARLGERLWTPVGRKDVS